MSDQLTSFSTFLRMSPFQQGLVSYLEAKRPGSDLASACPYPEGSLHAQDFERGRRKGIELERLAQESLED